MTTHTFSYWYLKEKIEVQRRPWWKFWAQDSITTTQVWARHEVSDLTEDEVSAIKKVWYKVVPKMYLHGVMIEVDGGTTQYIPTDSTL